MIPTKYDHDLAEIDNLHGCVLAALRTQRHAADRDLPGMRARLRETLEAYVDRAMALARERQ